MRRAEIGPMLDNCNDDMQTDSEGEAFNAIKKRGKDLDYFGAFLETCMREEIGLPFSCYYV
jgi:hypothetical protein